MKGSIAKSEIAKKIADALGSDYIGELGGKYYVWGRENGEKVQIAIALTCPKNPVELEANHVNGGISFEENIITTSVESAPAEITEEERERINLLLKKLGQF